MPPAICYGTAAGGGIGRQGVVFELVPHNGGWTENVLYAFDGNGDGTGPASSVVFDSAGNLYGTCADSSGSGGIVYELSPSPSGWTENILHRFHGGANDGFGAVGGVAIDAQGNLYGTTLYGGYYQQGTAYELSLSNGNWNFILLHSFESNEGPADTPTLDAAGNVYGTSLYSGGNVGLVFELSPDNGGWAYNNLHVFSGSDGEIPYAGVIFDRQEIFTALLRGAGAILPAWSSRSRRLEFVPTGSAEVPRQNSGAPLVYHSVGLRQGGHSPEPGG